MGSLTQPPEPAAGLRGAWGQREGSREGKVHSGTCPPCQVRGGKLYLPCQLTGLALEGAGGVLTQSQSWWGEGFLLPTSSGAQGDCRNAQVLGRPAT